MKEYDTINDGGYVCARNLRALNAGWLNVSQNIAHGGRFNKPAMV